MFESGLVVVAVGVILVIFGFLQRMKAGRVTETPLASTGEILRRQAAGGPKGQISAQGRVTCHQPLTAPFSGDACLFYQITCKAEWKDGEDKKQIKVLNKEQYAAPFTIDDGSGPVVVHAGEGGDFDSLIKKKETKGTGLFGSMLGSDLMFGSYRVNTSEWSADTKFTVEEELLPLTPHLYANGKIADQGDSIVPPNWRSLILSTKTRDALLALTTRSAKRNLIGGMAALFIGCGVSGTGFLLDDDGDDAPINAAVAARVPAPTPTPIATPAPLPAIPVAAPVATPTTAPVAPPPAKAGKGKPKKPDPKRGVSAKR